MFLKKLYYITLLITGSTLQLIGQGSKMHLRSPRLDFAASSFDSVTEKAARYFLVHVRPEVNRSDIKSNNVEIIRQLDNGYAIVRSNEVLQESHHAMFDTILYANNLWKLSRNLMETRVQGRSEYIIRTEQEKLALVVQLLSSIRELKFIEIRESEIIVQCSYQSILDDVLPISDVLYVGFESYKPAVESRVLDLNLEPNTVNRIHHVFPDLDGEGFTLSVKELAYNPKDIDLDGRHVSSTLMAAQLDDHATEMATIAAGAGNSFVTGRGVANAAHITSSDFNNLYPDHDADYLSLDAWVQNHSYGTEIENFYGSLAESFDQITNRNPQLLHVFSSGNKGKETSTTGNYAGVPGVANITGNFKMAKNILVVGSVDTVGREIFFSSRGPAFDGRVKPELVSYSTAGSSNSAALVSGIALLIQEAYKQDQGQLPSSAFIKALLINSAQDAGATGIDFITGYGNVDSYRSIQNLLAGRFFQGSLSNGETDNFVLTIPTNAKNLKVTIAWNDPAAPPNSSKALVNDLDMKVIDPSAATWTPWVLDATPVASLLTLPATRSVDRVNNVELITIEDLSSGDYTISITGFDVPEGPQLYHVTYQWDTIDHFEWSFPTGSDNMPYNGESSGYFRWKSTLSGAYGRLEYSIDHGNSWNVIQENVDLSKGYYRWLPPEIHTTAIARMVVDSESYITDQFTISRPISVQVGFNCADSVMLQWNAVTDAVEYGVFAFQDTYLELISILDDTTFVFRKDEFPSKWYAVQPLFLGEVPGIRSYTFDYLEQGVTCFVRNFNSFVADLDGILLTLELGTVYGVNEVFFERENNGMFEVVKSVEPGETSFFQYLDDNPVQGYNYHRARIRFDNGEEIVTDTTVNFFLTETPYVVFPNPVSRFDGLNVFADQLQSDNALFRLYGTDGRLALTQQLFSDREVVDLSDVHAGLYFYSIESNNRLYHGKILVVDN